MRKIPPGGIYPKERLAKGKVSIFPVIVHWRGRNLSIMAIYRAYWEVFGVSALRGRARSSSARKFRTAPALCPCHWQAPG